MGDASDGHGGDGDRDMHTNLMLSSSSVIAPFKLVLP